MKMLYGRIANAKDDNVYMSRKSFPIISRKGSSKTQEQAGIYFCKETKEETQDTKTNIYLSGNTQIFAFIFYKIFAERGNCVTQHGVRQLNRHRS